MSNPVLRQFVDDLKARYPTDGASMTQGEWICANTKLNGRRFSFKDYEFQEAIVNDMHPDLSVIKPSQVGMTEVQVRKFLAFLARNRGTSGIFTFPNERMFKSNSKTRIKPVVSQPAFGMSGIDDEKPNRAMNLYEVKGSWAHIMGMTEGEATSTPADILFHDEVDLSNQTMLGLFQSRLQNSAWKITQNFSTPTHAQFGIDAKFQASDQRQYMLKCGCCGHWQVPDFQMPFLHMPGYDGDGKLEEIDADMMAKIDLDACYVKCERCSKALDMRDPSLREWVAARPGRDAHGYQILPFSTWRLPIPYILRQLQKMRQMDNIKGWYNTVLGRTYSDANSKLEPDAVKAIMVGPAIPDVGADVPCALASDMGKICHLVVGAIRGGAVHPFLFEQVPADNIEARIKELRARYKIVAGAVDRHPYTPTSNQIRDDSRRKILPVEYRGTEFISLKEDEYDVLDFVQINRTKAIDEVVKGVRAKSWTMRGYGGLAQVVVEHMCDMVRVEIEEKPAVWEKLTGQDHFMHALVLLQACIKIHQIVLMTNAEPTKQFLGIVGVDAATSSRPRQLGEINRAKTERLI